MVGVFLSADSVQGNLAGMNPYGYVGGNPETYTDPSGQMYVPDPGGQDPGKQWQHILHNYAPASGPQSSCGSQSQLDCGWVWYLVHAHANTSIQVPASTLTGVGSVAWVGGRLDVGGGGFAPAVGIGGITFGIDIGAQGGLSLPCGGGTGSGSIQVTGQGSAAAPVGGCLTPVCFGEPNGSDERPAEGGAAGNAAPAANEAPAAGEGPCSFTASTPVATASGEEPIGTVQVGEQVWAYNPQTQHMELEPILHVWINHDHDLVDLTLTTSKPAPHGKPATRTSEVIHTNQKHPFLTKEQGFVPVGQITLGMHVLRADGTYGVVTGWKSVPGASVMYNLEVAQDHTFAVGQGQWVVHNCASGPTGNIGRQRVEYVRKNIDTLIPELGPEFPEGERLIHVWDGDQYVGKTDVDLLFEKGIVEVGGPAKANDLVGFERQLGFQRLLAQGNGLGLYFAYDASDGPIPSELQVAAEGSGAIVIQFILPTVP